MRSQKSTCSNRDYLVPTGKVCMESRCKKWLDFVRVIFSKTLFLNHLDPPTVQVTFHEIRGINDNERLNLQRLVVLCDDLTYPSTYTTANADARFYLHPCSFLARVYFPSGIYLLNEVVTSDLVHSIPASPSYISLLMVSTRSSTLI